MSTRTRTVYANVRDPYQTHEREEETMAEVLDEEVEAAARALNPEAWAVVDRLQPDDLSRQSIVGGSIREAEKALTAAAPALMLRAWREGWYAAAYANQLLHQNPYQTREREGNKMVNDQQIEALASKATEGPWEVEDCEGELFVGAGDALTQWSEPESDGIRFGTSPSHWTATNRIFEHGLDTWDRGEDKEDDQRRDDAEFIAAAREWVPNALRRLEALETAREHLTQMCEDSEAAGYGTLSTSAVRKELEGEEAN